jgi:hypothetical protein
VARTKPPKNILHTIIFTFVITTMDHNDNAFAAALPFQSITMIARLHAGGSSHHQQQHHQDAAVRAGGEGDFISRATGIRGFEGGHAVAAASGDGGVNNTATNNDGSFVPPPLSLLTKTTTTTTTTMTSVVEGEATVLPTSEEDELLLLLLRQGNRRSSWSSSSNKKRKEPTSDSSLPLVTAPTRRPRSTSTPMLSAPYGGHAAAAIAPPTTRLPSLPQLNVASIFAVASGTGGVDGVVGGGGVSFLADYLSGGGSGRSRTISVLAAPPTIFPPCASVAASAAKRRRSNSLSELSSDEELRSLPDVATMSSLSSISLPHHHHPTVDGGATSPRRPNTLEDSLNVMVASNSTGSTSIQNNLKLLFVDHNKGSSGSLVRSISR